MREMIYRAGGKDVLAKAWGEEMKNDAWCRRAYSDVLKTKKRERVRNVRHNFRRDLEQEFVDHYEHQMLPLLQRGEFREDPLLDKFPVEGLAPVGQYYKEGYHWTFWIRDMRYRDLPYEYTDDGFAGAQSVLGCRKRVLRESYMINVLIDRGLITGHVAMKSRSFIMQWFNADYEDGHVQVPEWIDTDTQNRLLACSVSEHKDQMKVYWSDECGCELCNFCWYMDERMYAEKYKELVARLNNANTNMSAALPKAKTTKPLHNSMSSKPQRPAWVPNWARWKPLSNQQ